MRPVIAWSAGPERRGKSIFVQSHPVKTRDAIVADLAGLDPRPPLRRYARHTGHDVIVIDTGGFEPDKPSGVVGPHESRRSKRWPRPTWWSSWSMDGRGVRARTTTSRYLRGASRRILLAVNKGRGHGRLATRLAEFHELGIGEPHPISAAHGRGIRQSSGCGVMPYGEASAEDDADVKKGRRFALAVARRGPMQASPP